MTNARVDALLAAYKRAGVSIDDDAVAAINRAAAEVFDTQGKYSIARIEERIGRYSFPPAVVRSMTKRIEAGISGIKARANRRLLTQRDEHILDARVASRRELTVPQIETATHESVAPSISVIIRLWDWSAKWEWYAGFFAGAFLMISIQEYFFTVILLVLSAISLLSKMMHNTHRGSLKIAEALVVALAFALFLDIVVAIKGSSPWSHLQDPFLRFRGLNPAEPPPKPVPPSPPVQLTPPVSQPVTKSVLPESNGFLQFAKIQYVTGHEFFTIGQPLQTNVYYQNKGLAPAQNAYISAAMFLVPRRSSISQSDMDAAVLKDFKSMVKQEKDKGSTLGVDNLLWVTPSLPFVLTQQMVESILSNELVLYVTSHARWRDSYGRPKETVDCVWLLPPNDVRPPLDTLRWRVCSR